jgi:hypothetical protein
VCKDAYATVTGHYPEDGDEGDLMTGTFHPKRKTDPQPYTRHLTISSSLSLCLRGETQLQIPLVNHRPPRLSEPPRTPLKELSDCDLIDLGGLG